MSSTNPLAAHLVQFAYIPSAVLIGAATLFKKELIPLAIAVAVALTGFQLVTGGMVTTSCLHRLQLTPPPGTKTPTPAVPAPSQPKTVLKPDEFQEFPITKKTQISHNTAIYRFSLPTEDAILGLPIGQHISLAATLDVKDPKTGEVTTKEVVRSYTPISSDNEKGYFDLIVKSYPTGNISRHLATLNVGDKMKVRGPKGAMVYTPNMARHIGMIAGGTGITPMLQVARAIQRGRKAGDKTKVDLIFANVNPEDILLKDDLDKLAAEDEHFNVYYVLNNPPETWAGGVGFVTGEMIKVCRGAVVAALCVLTCSRDVFHHQPRMSSSFCAVLHRWCLPSRRLPSRSDMQRQGLSASSRTRSSRSKSIETEARETQLMSSYHSPRSHNASRREEHHRRHQRSQATTTFKSAAFKRFRSRTAFVESRLALRLEDVVDLLILFIEMQSSCTGGRAPPDLGRRFDIQLYILHGHFIRCTLRSQTLSSLSKCLNATTSRAIDRSYYLLTVLRIISPALAT